MALCDLSCDLEQDTPLNRMVERRHSATHRFLTVHWMLGESGALQHSWLERVEWGDLVEGVHSQLAMARAALVYLACMIDIAEEGAQRRRQDETGKAGSYARIELFRAEPIEFD